MSIIGIAHINLIVPKGTLQLADEFYGETLGLKPRAVPSKQQGELAWFDIGDSGQQVHIAFGPDEVESRRHPCFKLGSAEALLDLQRRIWDHHVRKDQSAPRQADEPGRVNSGSQGVEYPTRFFARDFAGKHEPTPERSDAELSTY
jgi:catechol 2,3-dioxygenase-like lactoylglutathione lyase family enzyme